MKGNTFGKLFSLTSFGESHGPAMGVVIDGMPPGLKIDRKQLQSFLDRRAPGKTAWTSSRKELDEFEILSGIFEDKTLGTPIAIIVKNTNQISSDYESWKDEHRPGHADKTTLMKYGIRDHRGGGRASGRETLSRVIAGYFATLILPEVKIKGFISQLAHFKSDLIPEKINETLPFADGNQLEDIKNFLIKCKNEGESAGGTLRIIIQNPPPGLGEPVFDKLKADFAKAILSIGACTSFSYGLGEQFSHLAGGQTTKDSSAFGGIEGGISNGEDIHLTITVRAPSTVGKKAQDGRHDPCLLPRILPVVESMLLIVLADHYLRQSAYSQFLD